MLRRNHFQGVQCLQASTEQEVTKVVPLLIKMTKEERKICEVYEFTLIQYLILLHFQEAWERQCQDAETPLGKFYNTWKKLRDREIMHKLADKEKVG